MIDLEAIFFNIGAFICAVVVLDNGADRFIDHTIIVSKRLQLNDTLITLLVAGAEWEELAVVVAAVARGNPALALGNVLGSCISNILGAFSLGLLFRPFLKFDQTAKVYSLLQLVISVAVATSLATAGPIRLGKIGGGIFVASFVLYFLSIGYGIYRGIVKPPDEASSGMEDNEVHTDIRIGPEDVVASPEESHVVTPAPDSPGDHGMEHERLATPRSGSKQHFHRLRYHVAQIVIGFLALSLSGYVLAHSAAPLSSSLGLSETVVGLTILTFATTLPEKLVSWWQQPRGAIFSS